MTETQIMQALLLGARITDAACINGVTAHYMRAQFLRYCRDKRPDIYEAICITASNQGYSSPPVHYFWRYAAQYFEPSVYHQSFHQAGESPEATQNRYESELLRIRRELSRIRLQLCAVKGLRDISINNDEDRMYD